MQAAEVTPYTSVFNYEGMFVKWYKIEIDRNTQLLNDSLSPILILIILLSVSLALLRN